MFTAARKTIYHDITVNIVKILFFTTLITLIIFFLILRKNDPKDLLLAFAMSCIGSFSIYHFAKISVTFIKTRQTIQYYFLHVILFVLGSSTGSFLNCVFHFIVEEKSNYNIQKSIFLYTFIFGSIFYGGLLYHFNSRRKIDDSKRRFKEEKIKRLTLEKETTLTALKVLQAQIEPHFLFNTLSNIISLFDLDPQKAKKMLLDLNEYLQVSLQITRQDMITLEQEISLIRQYLDIFKVRMGKRLTYEIDQMENCSLISFPPMIIQPLVENAIKYGLEPKKEGGHIKVKCRKDQNCLKITVSDTGIGMDKMNDIVGIGLNNISSRLESIYGDRATLTLTGNKPSGVKAIIEVIL